MGCEHQTLQRLAPKPIERRALYSNLSSCPQGEVELWVDILSQKKLSYPALDIAPPPLEDYEVRVIIWKAKDIRAWTL